MEDQAFHQASTVRRKPLPRDSRHGHTISGSSLDGEAFPLVQVDNSFPWSPPPDLYYKDTSYEASRNMDPPETAQIQNDGGYNIFNRNTRYSRLGHAANQQNDSISFQKDPLVSHNAIPQESKRNAARMWNPIWLHPLVLSGVILLSLALLAGLLILWHFAKLENGISTDITENHYAWTYGPTALLVVIGVVWKQVDLYCRTLAPWARLRHGPVPANKSLLLDYVSPILPKALGAAALNQEWTVLASGLGILFLRIVIVFSTGLLVLTPTTVSKPTNDAVVNSKFVGTNYTGPSILEDHELMRYYGVQEQGMEYQYGANGVVAYETIDLGSIVLNATVTTTVNGVFPFFNCEIVQPKIETFKWENDGEYPYADNLVLNMTLTPAKCPGVVLISFPNFCQPAKGECGAGQYIYSNEQWYSPELPFGPSNNESDPCAHLYQVSITDLDYVKIDGHPLNSSASWDVTMPNSVGLVCTLGYTVDTLNVTINTEDPTSPGGVNTSSQIDRVLNVLPGYSYTNFTAYYQNEAIVNYLPTPPAAPNIYGFAQLFAIISGGSATALLDPEKLKDAAERAYKGVGVQIAHSFLRKDDNRTVTATTLSQEQRLQIRIVSVWAMAVGFVLLAFSALAILVFRPRNVVSCDPNSIASHAAILAASPSLQLSLEGSGSHTLSQLRSHCAANIVGSRVTAPHGQPQFAIETFTREEGHEILLASSTEITAWWKPMSTTFWFMALAILLPVGVIISLEVLQRESEAHNGLVNISATSIVEHSLPSIFTSLIMITIAMMYDAINFAAATLAPYQALARGSATARRTLISVSLEDLPLWSTLEAIRSGHGSAVVSSVAVILGSVLTVIASGLYTVENVPFATDVSILALDKFVPSFSTSTDGGAGGVFSLIQANNASYPALTYDELVFPRLALSSLGAGATKQLGESQEVTLRARVPAIRAALNCTVVPRDTMVRTNVLPSVAEPDTRCPNSDVNFNTSLPESCPHFLSENNKTATEIQFNFEVQYECSIPNKLGVYQGQILPSVNGIYLGPEGTTLGAPSNPPGCPSLAFIYGCWLVNSTSTENVTAMTCIQGFEQVQTNTTFVVSKDLIQVKSPPVVDEASKQWFSSFNSTYWFTKYTEIDSLGSEDNPANTTPDDFIQNVIFGPDGVPWQDLAGPANTDRFVAAIQHTYRKFMAQLINSNMRQSLSTSDASAIPHYPATVSDINVLRLKQHAPSKLTLQVFLGVMLACGLVVYGGRNTRRVVPHCPWSIAGTMSLLAGSEMVERKVVPEGAEFMSRGELAKVFEGYVFSLGWWDAGGGKTSGLRERKRFGVDIGTADVSFGRGRVVQ